MKNEHDLDPKKDWVFKLMFTHGEMGNTVKRRQAFNQRFLIDFLNAFLADSFGKRVIRTGFNCIHIAWLPAF